MGDLQGSYETAVYTDGPDDVHDDVRMTQQYYIHDTPSGRMVGKTSNVTFVLPSGPADVWPFLKDFNQWQNGDSHYYSGVVGDLEGKTFNLRLTADAEGRGPDQYHVLRVIPEHLIVLRQPGEWEGGASVADGFHVFVLTHHRAGSLVSVFMQHARRVEDREAEATAQAWLREVASDSRRKWLEVFIPTLGKLVQASS
jgi:uncharacterized protein YndB with AHSA1/START domain